MLIKSADDKSKRLALLESLVESPVLVREQKKWAEDQLWALRTGIQGERDAAFYIDSHFKDAPNHAVLHDLRLVVDDDVVQIDHLVIARGFTFYLLETKCFNGSLLINEHGEFSVRYGAERLFGIESPLEQSRRHAKLLSKVLERLGIAGRLKQAPDFRHVVLVHPRATIQRPDAKKFDTSHVIKADQFATWRERHVEKDVSVLQVLGSVLNLRSADTVREWAEMLVRQHRPSDPLALPDFMKPREAAVPSAVPPKAAVTAKAASAPATPGASQPVCATCGVPVSDAVAHFCRVHSRQFDGGIYCREHQSRVGPTARVPAVPAAPKVQQPAAVPPVHAVEPVAAPEEKKRLVCASCGGKITFDEGRFCWGRPQRFGGLQYCREHQAAFK